MQTSVSRSPFLLGRRGNKVIFLWRSFCNLLLWLGHIVWILPVNLQSGLVFNNRMLFPGTGCVGLSHPRPPMDVSRFGECLDVCPHAPTAKAPGRGNARRRHTVSSGQQQSLSPKLWSSPTNPSITTFPLFLAPNLPALRHEGCEHFFAPDLRQSLSLAH